MLCRMATLFPPVWLYTTHGPQVRGPFLNTNKEPRHAACNTDNEGH